jgi:VanZ family protein
MAPRKLPFSRAVRAAERVTQAQLGAGSANAWRNTALALWCFAWLPIAALSLGPAPAAPGSDKLHHFLVYGVMSFAALGFARGARGLLTAAATTLALGGLFELLQTTVPGRSGEWADFGADAVGALLGCALALLVLRRWPRPPA